MLYLDYTKVLPPGAPEPDLSNQPQLQDYIPADLWKRRLKINLMEIQGWIYHPEVRQFRACTDRWLKAVQDHTKQIEAKNGIEFCNWQVYSDSPGSPNPEPSVWIQHAVAGPDSPQARRQQRNPGTPEQPGENGRHPRMGNIVASSTTDARRYPPVPSPAHPGPKSINLLLKEERP